MSTDTSISNAEAARERVAKLVEAAERAACNADLGVYAGHVLEAARADLAECDRLLDGARGGVDPLAAAIDRRREIAAAHEVATAANNRGTFDRKEAIKIRDELAVQEAALRAADVEIQRLRVATRDGFKAARQRPLLRAFEDAVSRARAVADIFATTNDADGGHGTALLALGASVADRRRLRLGELERGLLAVALCELMPAMEARLSALATSAASRRSGAIAPHPAPRPIGEFVAFVRGLLHSTRSALAA